MKKLFCFVIISLFAAGQLCPMLRSSSQRRRGTQRRRSAPPPKYKLRVGGLQDFKRFMNQRSWDEAKDFIVDCWDETMFKAVVEYITEEIERARSRGSKLPQGSQPLCRGILRINRLMRYLEELDYGDATKYHEYWNRIHRDSEAIKGFFDGREPEIIDRLAAFTFVMYQEFLPSGCMRNLHEDRGVPAALNRGIIKKLCEVARRQTRALSRRRF